MLQGALLLLGCALSRYLWEIDTTVASVVLAVTSFGALFYLFIVAAGASSDSCPYQTPGANVVRHVIRHVPGLFRPAYVLFLKRSQIHCVFVEFWGDISEDTAKDIIIKISLYPLALLIAFADDAFHLGEATFRILVAFPRRARSRLFRTSPLPNQALDNPATRLDFRCISWMLQTSLDKTINLLTFNFLKTILALSGLDSSTAPAVFVDCFNIFSSCFVTSDGVGTMATRGSEQLVGISAMCFLHAFYCLSSAEPTSTIIRDVRQRYKRVFPYCDAFQYLPSPIIVNAIHNLLQQNLWRQLSIDWSRYNPSTDELVPFSRALVQAAQFECRRQWGELPIWLVGFPLRFLSQDPLPPISVIIDCLIIIATGLDCDDNNVTSDEGCVYTSMTTLSRANPTPVCGLNNSSRR